MAHSVVIIGASGHGKVIADIILKSGDRIIGFLDDDDSLANEFCGYPILGHINRYTDYSKCKFIIAIGNASVRAKIVKKLKNVTYYTAIHPSAQISSIEVELGEGTSVMANAVINSGAIIGKHCIINSGAVVEHDNYIEDYVHISVGSKLAGTVRVGARSWIGIGAVISNNLTICRDCTIGAGTVVVCNITRAGTYIGVPAKCLEADCETSLQS